MYATFLRPALFAMSRHDPEKVHDAVLDRLAWASERRWALRLLERTSSAPSGEGRTIFGLHFPNPLGLASGLDKNGRALPALAALGFGFVEAGTVTRHGQEGNPRPRITRLVADRALVNKMGFPNQGADRVASAQDRAAQPVRVPLGWNISKSMVTSLDEAAGDYLYTLRRLHDHGDFFTVNVSSPNTPGLRRLQERGALEHLVGAVCREAAELARGSGRSAPKPVLVKIAPDLSAGQIEDIVGIALSSGVSGIIATNTTIERPGLRRPTDAAGGLSGPPLFPRAVEVVRTLSKLLDGRLPIIGVGGIASPDDAHAMLEAGADLLQVYTGFVYQGPRLVRRINAEVRRAWLASGAARALRPPVQMEPAATPR